MLSYIVMQIPVIMISPNLLLNIFAYFSLWIVELFSRKNLELNIIKNSDNILVGVALNLYTNLGRINFFLQY